MNDKKRLVLTLAIGDVYKKLAKISHPTLRRYAERIGADFLSIDESSTSTPHWAKFQIFDLLNQYERIIYLDTDLIVRDDCPDLFEIVPQSYLGIFNEAPFTDGRATAIQDVLNQYGETLPEWDGKYYNTGVMVISRGQKYLFKKPDKEVPSFYEQGYLNMKIAKDKVWIHPLEYQFNRMTCMDGITGEERFSSYIIHYAGYHYVDDGTLSFISGLIAKDIARWTIDSPNYNYRRHILIDVQGGLGDQVDAEPAIRFLKDHVYPGDDVIVVTHFPILFKHLDLPVFIHGEFQPSPDTPYYHILTLPGPNTVTWSVVSNLLCHTVDYVSMALLRRTLPLKDRRIRLDVDLSDIAGLSDVIGARNLEELVLVHPGRHWTSKTFPVSWWQSIVDGLHEEGLPVCLIGKEEDGRGVVDIEAREGMIDTRDLLDLGSLICLIARANLLISNDSAPIHIAGAFDNSILLIPSCKHPDHLLPYRNGGHQDYKARALYKRLTLDDCVSQPTAVHGASGEFVKGNILDYLPEPEEVVATAVEMFKVGSCV